VQYLNNIRDAILTTAKSMRITLKYWVKEPAITIEYPDRLGKGKTPEDLVSERYRGFLKLDSSKCIGCFQCMRTCPIDCILIRTEKIGEERFLTRFDVDQSKCMHCGLCVEVCPTDAITFSKRFEGACYDIRELCIKHIQKPVPAAKSKTAEKEG
jgi:NADH-quinone oxidoreductase subunit I